MHESIVYNIDCMEYMKTLPDKAFDLAIVDPPYGGVSQGGYMNGTGRGRFKQKDYHKELWNQPKPSEEYFLELFRVSENQIIWGGNNFTSCLPEVQGWIVWDKQHPEGIKFADFEMAWTSFDMAGRIFRFLWNGAFQGDMKNKEERIHPTQKPVALYKWLLKTFAKDGDRILDTHLGSGSSRIACAELGFDFVGCEIDKTYFDLQEKRFKEWSDQLRFDF